MWSKSETCLGRVSGEPLTVYWSRSEAEDGAWHVRSKHGREMAAYQCDRCGGWHLAPADRQTTSRQSGCCHDRNGRPKALYATESDARRRAEILAQERGTSLTVYRCPEGGGWHLTKGDGARGRSRW
jgi:predicted RNA-binding Zn-ribbon protein involved in translation (DUF1610 family)